MPRRVERRTVDLSGYPDLVVIYLGMRVNRIAGIKTLRGFGPKISSSVDAHPDGLLSHENFVFSFFPMHAGTRQYWRDQESLLKWTRSAPHRQWWQKFLKGSGGTGFWHETYAPPWWHGSHLRRYRAENRIHEFRPGGARSRTHVRRSFPCWDGVCRTACAF
jgi:hypothetical protein